MWHCHLLSLFEQCKLICVCKLIDMFMEVDMCIELTDYIMVKLWLSCACCCFFNIRSAMVSKHSELMKRQARYRYGRFVSSSSGTAPPLSRHEVGSSNCRHTAPPPSCMQEVGSSYHCYIAPPPSSDSDDSVEMWMPTPPPPPTRLAPSPPLTCVWVCPHLKEVSSHWTLILDFNCLV
jgi:hypothetical protein